MGEELGGDTWGSGEITTPGGRKEQRRLNRGQPEELAKTGGVQRTRYWLLVRQALTRTYIIRITPPINHAVISAFFAYSFNMIFKLEEQSKPQQSSACQSSSLHRRQFLTFDPPPTPPRSFLLAPAGGRRAGTSLANPRGLRRRGVP